MEPLAALPQLRGKLRGRVSERCRARPGLVGCLYAGACGVARAAVGVLLRLCGGCVWPGVPPPAACCCCCCCCCCGGGCGCGRGCGCICICIWMCICCIWLICGSAMGRTRREPAAADADICGRLPAVVGCG